MNGQPLGPVIGDADEVYLSFKETPFDTLPAGYKDGDNSQLEGRHLTAALDFHSALEADPVKALLAPKSPAGPRRVIVPHPRDLKKGSVGQDVFALQRALAAAGLRKWGHFTRTDGVGVVAEVKKFQHEHGIPASGVYNEETHRKLAGHYDAFGVFLLTSYGARLKIEQAQHAILAAAAISYNFRNTIHYTEGGLRWMMISNHVRAAAIPAQRSLWADCSSWFTWLYWDLGTVPDPNELEWGGGYTGTLGAHGKVIDPAKAKPGAAFLYGPGTHSHVQMSVGGTATIGNGSEAGPLYLSGDYRGDLNVVRAYPGLS